MTVDEADVNLTRRQREILDYIEDFRVRERVSPTHREIRDHFGYSSYGTVYKHLRLLREKGLLARERNQRRGIVVKAVSSASGGRGRDSGSAVSDVVFHGRIAAGRPIEAIAGSDSVAVPAQLMKGSGDHYVLQVNGQSMIDEGICDGDLVVVLSRQDASPGEMVVALIDGEATLKRFYPEGPNVRLQPSNAQMEPIRVKASDLEIQGIVVGLMRRY